MPSGDHILINLCAFCLRKKMLCVIKLVGHYHFIYLTIYDVEAQNKPHYVGSLDGFMEVVLV